MNTQDKNQKENSGPKAIADAVTNKLLNEIIIALTVILVLSKIFG